MLRWAAVGLVLALVAACGASEEPNDADVDFATTMIEHHAEAIRMANVTIGREGLDPRIAELAEEVRLEQTEEIDTMSAWLREWDEPVPETGFATGDGHTHSEEEGHGDLESLASAPTPRFESRWLEMMIEHHESAVEMAERVAAAGRSPEVADLAETIGRQQRAEITRMSRWLAGP